MRLPCSRSDWDGIHYYDYYAYNWRNYKFGDEDFISKYTDMDGKTILDKEDDVASAKLESPWRMPTEAEFKELIEKCAWKWTKWYNMQGYKVVGPNGKYIFLPAAGANCYKEDEYDTKTNKYSFDSLGYGNYWSRNISHSHECALRLAFDKDGHQIIGGIRCAGLTIRPVFK